MRLLPQARPGDPVLKRFQDRRPRFNPEQASAVAAVIASVEAGGAQAVLDQVRQHDAPGLESLFVSPEEIESASVAPEQHEAIKMAIQRVDEFHETQLGVITEGWESLSYGWAWRTSAVEHPADPAAESIQLGPFKIPVPDAAAGAAVRGSGMMGQRMLPMDTVGVYVPGGKAAYPSSVIMNAVPARVAGTPTICVATPPRRDGTLHPAVLVACRELEITTILKAGGAAAVAAMALGIEGMPRVDLLVGPGSTWVTEAKRQLWGTVGLTAYAGPSEVAVLAQADADPLHVAADFLTQLEHGEDNSGMLIVFSDKQAREVLDAMSIMLTVAPRQATLRHALEHESCMLIVDDLEQAVEAVNKFAPEHLAILGSHPELIVEMIERAGCVALGGFTPQSAGDYVTGPSHTLPTSGAARFGSPVSVQDFLRLQSISQLEKEDLALLAPVIKAFAEMEGFPAHGNGVASRGL